jgi:hypothetical protein
LWQPWLFEANGDLGCRYGIRANIAAFWKNFFHPPRSVILWARQNDFLTSRKEALTMRTSPATHLVWIAVIGLMAGGTVTAQDTGTTLPTLPTADTGTAPIAPTLPPAEPTPPVQGPAPWTWQHQTQNQQGTVTNLHERTQDQDGNAYNYQHSVTRPNGSHTQLRDYSQTDEGYHLMRQQRFYKPDGTLLREHGMAVTGTDPYNYQRQMTHTFRDGRTMDKTFTRSYDGTTGTMERSFVGPNGQVRQFERPWAPDDLVDTGTPIVASVDSPTPQEAGLPTTEQLGTISPTIVDPLAPTTSKAKEGFFSRLNPFKNRESKRSAGSSSTARRSGFTIGSFGRSRRMDTIPPGQARKASGLSNSSQMRSMKTKMNQTGRPAHASASLPSQAGKKH